MREKEEKKEANDHHDEQFVLGSNIDIRTSSL